MRDLSRRRLLLLAAGTALAPAIAGCSTTPSSIPTWVSAIEAIGTEVGQVLTLLPSSVPAATVSEIQTIITSIESAAAAIGASSTQTDGQSTLIQIEGYLNALVPIVEPYLAAIPSIGSVLGIIVAAIPAIEAAVNIVTSLLSSQAQALASDAPAPASVALRHAGRRARARFYLRLLLARARGRR